MSHALPYAIFIAASITGVVMWFTHGVVYGFSKSPPVESPPPVLPTPSLQGIDMSKLTEVLHLMPLIASAVITVEGLSNTALDGKLTSSQKLTQAGAIVLATLSDPENPAANPKLATDFAAYWPAVSTVISSLVTIYNIAGVFIKLPK